GGARGGGRRGPAPGPGAVAGGRGGAAPPRGPPLAPAARQALLERALRPARFYRQVFVRRLGRAPRAAALYLPGLDIAADGFRGSALAFADLERAELAQADALLAQALPGVGTAVVVLDPGRRARGGEGRGAPRRRARARRGPGGARPGGGGRGPPGGRRPGRRARSPGPPGRAAPGGPRPPCSPASAGPARRRPGRRPEESIWRI